MPRQLNEQLTPQIVLDSINDGIYVTDRDRTILYWNTSAERITGWTSDEVVGKRCFDDILSHVDKDGHVLCGRDYCPLHRCILNGCHSVMPIMVFARTKSGRRIPLQVSVAPIRDGEGNVIGGVETFRDMSDQLDDFQRAARIQALCLQRQVPDDPRIRFRTRYVPHDVVGGDFYAIGRLDDDRYGVLLADVTGHGVPAALYTMCISSLWDNHHGLLADPCRFAHTINQKLRTLIVEDEPFAAGLCALIDLQARVVRLVGAGNPGPLLFSRDGQCSQIRCCGLPFGCIKDAPYTERQTAVNAGDTMLFFTDGAVEIKNHAGARLDVPGLIDILRGLGYPDAEVDFRTLEEAILAYSSRIRLDDDLAFVEVRFT